MKDFAIRVLVGTVLFIVVGGIFTFLLIPLFIHIPNAEASSRNRDYPDREYDATITRWIDGDSAIVDIKVGLGIWLHDQHLRLNRVDTPERGEEDYQEATKVSMRVCSPGRAYPIQVLGKDKYGRWVVEMTCVGVNLNDSLIQRGWEYEK